MRPRARATYDVFTYPSYMDEYYGRLGDEYKACKQQLAVFDEEQDLSSDRALEELLAKRDRLLFDSGSTRSAFWVEAAKRVSQLESLIMQKLGRDIDFESIIQRRDCIAVRLRSLGLLMHAKNKDSDTCAALTVETGLSLGVL